jgi:hypothetical protein
MVSGEYEHVVPALMPVPIWELLPQVFHHCRIDKWLSSDVHIQSLGHRNHLFPRVLTIMHHGHRCRLLHVNRHTSTLTVYNDALSCMHKGLNCRNPCHSC